MCLCGYGLQRSIQQFLIWLIIVIISSSSCWLRLLYVLSLHSTWSASSIGWCQCEINVFLWIQPHDIRGNVDDLLSNPKSIHKCTKPTHAEWAWDELLHVPYALSNELSFVTYRMCLCLMSTRAWWIDLANPSLKTWVCRRLSRKSSTLNPST